MKILFSSAEGIPSQVKAANEWEILSAQEDKIHIPKWPCNVLFII